MYYESVPGTFLQHIIIIVISEYDEGNAYKRRLIFYSRETVKIFVSSDYEFIASHKLQITDLAI